MTQKPKGRKPDWTIRTLNKTTEERGTIGAAWTNQDGSISIQLNSHVIIRQNKDEIITMFPERNWQNKEDQQTRRENGTEELGTAIGP